MHTQQYLEPLDLVKIYCIGKATMFLLKLLKKTTEKARRSVSNESLPPVYSEPTPDGNRQPSTFRSHSDIDAETVPQWKWSTSQCQAWLYSAYVKYFNFSPEEAERAIYDSEGFGPTMYLNTAKQWAALIGQELSPGLWATIRIFEKGTVPRGFCIWQGELKLCGSSL